MKPENGCSVCVCVCATHFEAIVHFWLLLFSKIELIQVQQAESITTINCAIEHNAIHCQQYAFNSILQIKILFCVWASSSSFIFSLPCPSIPFSRSLPVYVSRHVHQKSTSVWECIRIEHFVVLCVFFLILFFMNHMRLLSLLPVFSSCCCCCWVICLHKNLCQRDIYVECYICVTNQLENELLDNNNNYNRFWKLKNILLVLSVCQCRLSSALGFKEAEVKRNENKMLKFR